ncbi:MAG: S-layer homology domain-containing protein [Firmicutes bacterium]|nr:S-layer homology domain-containing protein [Bacillota bacterium]
MKHKSRIRFYTLLAILLAAGIMLPWQSAYADDGAGGNASLTYVYPNGSTTITDYNVVESSDAVWDGNSDGSPYYVVASNVTLENCVTVKGNVILILCDGTELNAAHGLNVEAGNNACLEIFAQEKGTGKLTAQGDGLRAGIGSGDNRSGGKIVINGGVINATGGYKGAGIGGGRRASSTEVIIRGGDITATGNAGAAGIGGGCAGNADNPAGNGGKVSIYGGTVNVRGINKAAGIGGGGPTSGNNGGAGGDVAIYGGTVIAYSNNAEAHAIGAAAGNSNNGSLTVYENAVVHSGRNENNAEPVSETNGINDRVNACRSPYARISACENHSYTVFKDITKTTHTPVCAYCRHVGEPEGHSYGDDDTCACGARQYNVTVQNGTADKIKALEGDTITVTANNPAEGVAFVQWAYVEGVNFSRMDAIETTFPMPAKDVTLTPVYKEITPEELDDQVYTGKAIEPTFGLFGMTLDGVDAVFPDKYDLSYADNVDVGEAKVIITLNDGMVGTKTVSFNILPAEIEVTTGSATKAYDGTPLTQADGTITGLVNSEKATVTTSGSQTYAGSSENGYTIDWDTAKASNYNIKTENLGTLTVTAAQQEPTITPTVKLYRGGNDFDLSTLVSDAQGDVSFTVKSGDAATISGTTLTPSASATGEVIITVNITEKDLGGDAAPEYSAYTADGAITATVVKKENAAVSIAGGNISKTYGDPDFRLAATAANEGENGVWTWRSSNEAVAKVDNNGKVTIVRKGNASITAVYESATTLGEATVKLTVKPKSNPSSEGTSTRYSLTYETNGGSSIAAAKHDKGAAVSLSETPTKEGYTFTGWYADKALTERITSIKMDGNKTVYAGWKENEKPVEPGHDCPSVHLTDVNEGDWFHAYVDYVIEKGLMQGVSTNEFAPNSPLTRGMIVTILYRLAGSPAAAGDNPFEDVAAGQWYADAVIWANRNGVVEGYGNGKFGPNDLITREQFAAILYRYEQNKGGGFTGAWMFLLDYEDAGQISEWADEAMHWCVMKEIITGRSATTLVPQGNATRAEAAAMLMRFIENAE